MKAITLCELLEHIVHEVVDVRKKGISNTEVTSEQFAEIKKRI